MAADVGCCRTEFFLYLLSIVGLVTFAGLMAGLTLGLMSLGLVDLEVLKKSGRPQDRIHAGTCFCFLSLSVICCAIKLVSASDYCELMALSVVKRDEICSFSLEFNWLLQKKLGGVLFVCLVPFPKFAIESITCKVLHCVFTIFYYSIIWLGGDLGQGGGGKTVVVLGLRYWVH